MKTILKNYIVPFFFLIAFTISVSAQKKSNVKRKVVVKTTTPKTKVNAKVSSTKVTYKKPKKKVVAVRNVSNRIVVKHKGQNYYYANNKYYTQSRGRYIVIAPKVGFRIKVLPQNYKRVRFNNRNYFNVQGIFYLQINNEYEVVDPEIGTIVYVLPTAYEKVVIDGLTYYEYANILYEKTQVNGERAYEVVGIIEMD